MNSRTRIAVVGASVRGTAFSLLRAGCDVVAADLFADADLQRVCPTTRIVDYPDGLANWLADTPCDGWLYTGALENHPELVDRMAKLRPLLGNRGNVLRRVRDPMALQEVLKAAGLSFPETKVCAGSAPGAGDWLHKTGQGGNGSGVSSITDKFPKSGYWQREIEGTPGSAQFVADGTGTCKLLGMTRQLVGEGWTGAAEFQYCGTLAPWDLPTNIVAELAVASRVLTAQFGLIGLFGIDFIFDGKHAWIIEVNPRVTAAMEVVERATGRNPLAEHLDAFGIFVKQCETPGFPAAGKAVLYAKHSLTVTPQLSEQLSIIGGRFNFPLFADIPSSGTEVSPTDPILTILAVGNDLTAVESELRDWVVILETYFYRDIGGS